ncbi:MAG: 2Fe-2S iron-sulfur cluster-binding protein [Pseudomonadota bacterium]
MRHFEVHFVGAGRQVLVAEGVDLLTAARLAGAPLGSSCGGEGSCGWCRVVVLEGADGLSEPNPRERALARKLGLAADERVACMARVHGEVRATTSYWGAPDTPADDGTCG